jgi:hypothetical protein
MTFGFAPGVFACIADGQLVILNVPADRYLMLPPEAEASLLRLVRDQPAEPADQAVWERLCTSGLILQKSPQATLALCEAITPLRSLLDDGWTPSGASPVWLAGVRALTAGARLKMNGLEGALRRMTAVPAPTTDDLDHVMAHAAAFAELRLAIRALDRCLPLSIALATIARRQHRDVRLVLGVRCHPFCAHAWVQLGATVLNDRLDTVRSFTPILAL